MKNNTINWFLPHSVCLTINGIIYFFQIIHKIQFTWLNLVGNRDVGGIYVLEQHLPHWISLMDKEKSRRGDWDPRAHRWRLNPQKGHSRAGCTSSLHTFLTSTPLPILLQLVSLCFCHLHLKEFHSPSNHHEVTPAAKPIFIQNHQFLDYEFWLWFL